MLVGKKFESPFVGIPSALRDHKLFVQFQQLEVGLRDAADDGDHDRVPAFLRGNEVCARGFVHPAHASPQINFPNCFEAAEITVHDLATIGRRRGQKSISSTSGFALVVRRVEDDALRGGPGMGGDQRVLVTHLDLARAAVDLELASEQREGHRVSAALEAHRAVVSHPPADHHVEGARQSHQLA